MRLVEQAVWNSYSGGKHDLEPQPPREPTGDRAVSVERGAGGVVFDAAGAVLLLRHASGHWVFPKGHVEAGESEVTAALREVREEAGVVAECESDVHWHTTYVNPRGSRRLITWFVCTALNDSVILEEDLFQEGAFLPVERAFELLSHGSDRELLATIVAWRTVRSAGSHSAGNPSEAPT